MSTGLVYLRPLEVAFARRVGPHHSSALAAWEHISEWLAAKNYKPLAPTGFGLVHKTKTLPQIDMPVYDACIELIDPIMIDLVAGIDQCRIPGGAFLRHRHIGGPDTMAEAFRNLRTAEAKRRGLKNDDSRPLIEIYIKNQRDCTREQRIDLCVPVLIP